MDNSSKNIKFGFIVFVALVIFCIAQLTWWVIFQIEQSSDRLENQISNREQKIETVSELVNNMFCQIVDHAHAIASAQIDPKKLIGLLEPIKENRAVLGYSYVTNRGGKLTAGEIDSTLYATIEDGFTIYFSKQFIVTLFDDDADDFMIDFSVPHNGQNGIWIDQNNITISPQTIEHLKDNSHRAVKMFASEGSIFLLIMILGAYLIYRALQKTEELKARQTNFMHAMTHELKTPLTSIRLYLETLQSGNIDSSKTDEIYNKMIVDCDRLDEMVDDVLGASRLDSINSKMDLSEINLSNNLNDFLNGFENNISQQNGILKREIDDGIIIRANSDELNRAIKTVIENALKYSPPDRKVLEVRLIGQNNCASITIIDSGFGIKSGELKNIFDRFYRISNSKTETIKGTGLGLFIAEQIIKAHRGTIKAQSAGIDKGTSFIIELPMVTK